MGNTPLYNTHAIVKFEGILHGIYGREVEL
jgi:hypothetical protein